MNKPELTTEVNEFLTIWEEYRQAITNCRFNSPEAWVGNSGYFEVIKYNTDRINDNRAKMDNIESIAARLVSLGEEVAAAAEKYKTALYIWQREQEAEAERPRREWEDARDEYVKGLKSTIRSLSIKIGHAESKVYALPSGEERDAAYDRLKSLRAEKQIADQLENAVTWLRWSNYQGQTFTEQTVLDYIETQKQNWAHVMEQLTGQAA